jgi:hypothetical protein
MSEISDYIAAQGADNVAAKLVTLPNWRLFNTLWKSPKDIAAACDRLGVFTLAAYGFRNHYLTLRREFRHHADHLHLPVKRRLTVR